MKKRMRLAPLFLSVIFLFTSIPSFAATIKIIAIKDLSASVHMNQIYSLPKVVDATMSNKTTQKVAVTWSPKTAATSKAGIFVYKGTVKGYSKLVLLTLKVQPKPNTIDKNSDNLEIQRAILYGFVPKEIQGEGDKPVTYKQFCTLMGNMLTLHDSSLAKNWSDLTKNIPNSTITRQEAMVGCLLAGKLMGLMEARNYTLEENIDPINPIMSSKLYPSWNKPVTYSTDGNGRWDDYIIGGIFYGMRLVSNISGTPLFTTEGKDLRINKVLTREEAVLATTRLYEADRRNARASEKVYRKQLDDSLKQLRNIPEFTGILTAADKRREEILNSKTTIMKGDTYIPGKTYTGNAYYVSNRGNDSADGLTPETAWESLKKVNTISLGKGDAVFFERGGLWRGHLLCQDNVTYSAYGDGQKPRIYGSPENGADPQKWSLLKGTSNIWVFYKDMYDTSGLVFNEGEDFANRMVGFWNGKRYVEILEKTKYIDVKNLNNLEIFSDIDYTGYTTEQAKFELLKKGKVYLRCDAGNPGQVFKSIEFLCQEDSNGDEQIVQGSDGNTIDNLCLMYTSVGGMSLKSNSIAQNCEVGWMGGAVMNFYSWGGYCILTVGDGINIGRPYNKPGTNCTILNNYVHDIYDFALTVEIGPEGDQDYRYVEHTTIKGNLTERSSGGVNITDWGALNEGWSGNMIYKNFIIEDNYLMYSGYSQSHLTLINGWDVPNYQLNNGNANVLFGFPAEAGKDISVKNNVLFLSTHALVSGRGNDYSHKMGKNYAQKFEITFSGNTFVQNEGRNLAEWHSPDKGGQIKLYPFDQNVVKTIIDVMGDRTAKVKSIK